MQDIRKYDKSQKAGKKQFPKRKRQATLFPALCSIAVLAIVLSVVSVLDGRNASETAAESSVPLSQHGRTNGAEGDFDGASDTEGSEGADGAEGAAAGAAADADAEGNSKDDAYQADIKRIMARWQVLQPRGPSVNLRNIQISNHTTVPYSAEPPYALGTLSDSFVKDGLNTLNFVRYLAGLPDDVIIDSEYSLYCQSGSILLSYEFGHTPAKPQEMTEAFYQNAYKGTSNSNIAMGYSSLAETIRNGYMRDHDSFSNVSTVGHRRWILNPAMKKTGLGFITARGKAYSALYAIDRTRASVPDYQWIAWPNKSAFPIQFFNPEDPWSITLNPKKYQTPRSSEVKVTLTETATQKVWTFSQQDNTYTSAGKYFNVNTQSFGVSNCIVFRPDGVKGYRGKYHVSITGVKDISGQHVSIDYDVMFFDMNQY
jgi:hypothetical protein